MKNRRVLRVLCMVVFFLLIIGVLYLGKWGKAEAEVLVNDGGNGIQRPLSTREKLEDFNYMYGVLKENYPYFGVNKRLHNIDWLENKERYSQLLEKTASDEEFFKVLDQIVLSELNNSHTWMVGVNQYPYIKKFYGEDNNQCGLAKEQNIAWAEQINHPSARMRYDKGGVKSFSQGNVALGVNLTTRTIEENKIAYLGIKSFDGQYMDGDIKALKVFLSKVADYKALIIDIRGNTGGIASYWMDYLVPSLINEPIKNEEYLVFRGGAFEEHFIRCRLKKQYSDLEKIETIKEKNLKKLPPDLFNEFKYYSEHTMEIKPNEPVGFKGEIYLLVDRKVYSSAEMFATFAKNTGFATLVGERTGGDGIGMDPVVCTLPNSGYIFRFPQAMGLTSTGECNEEFKTEPDVKVNAEKNEDFNKDKAIQNVLNRFK